MVNLFGKKEEAFYVKGLQIGIVEDVKDKDGRNRVKIKMPMLSQKGVETLHVDVLTKMAGEDYGTIWVPEAKETVLVGFIGGRIENPIVLGSLYSGQRKPYKKVDAKNEVRAFKTKSGVEFLLEEKSKKPKITVDVPEKAKIVLDGSKGTLTITDNKSPAETSIVINLGKGEIILTAGKKITFKAGKTDSMTFESGKGLTVKSPAGDLKTDVKGIKLAAKANFEASGNASAKIKGAMANLEASGVLTLKGTMAKIN